MSQAPVRASKPGGLDPNGMRRAFAFAAALVGGIAALFIFWQAAHALLLIFAGILFGVLLDACIRGLRVILPLPRGWLLAILCCLLVAALGLLLLWGAVYLVQEFERLMRTLEEQIGNLRVLASDIGLRFDTNGGNGDELGRLLMEHAGGVLGPATTAVFSVAGIVVSAAIVVIVGVFAAANPQAHRDAILRLLPVDRRARVRETLDEVGSVLRWWLVGQLVAMVAIAATVAVALWLLGVPAAIVLGLQAGLLAFIPYFGPFLAGVPIGLAAMTLGLWLLAITLLVYSAIQIVEGYWMTPLIHQQAVALPPLLTISGLLVMGTLFGIGGVVLSTPLLAALRVMVLRLYVEDVLERPKNGHVQEPAE